ncbi:chitin synthase [Rhizoctonia solani AG-1 IB]|uniref:Chitin synthase n=1 Tax=Thanatephorus cucumeris (strain AG1-IB / isolate 7/3/14) TaxID=1108050 RepID=A0A0B7FM73_THACB|nr:chitin synthase [Rhizoctonia solani AG-1 IB]
MAYSNRYQQAPTSPNQNPNPNPYTSPHSPSTPHLGVDPFATPTPSYDDLTAHAGSATPTYAPAYRAHSPTATHPLAPDMAYNQPYDNRAYSHDVHPEWDSRSAKSYQTYNSQAHLDPHNNKQYEMSQFSAVPSLPYNPAPGIVDYPPQQPAHGAGLRPPVGGSQHSNSGYSTAREKMMRRRTVRHVELQQGNLVLDMPVPTTIVPDGCTAEEQTHMRYTAVTCDPDDFASSKYTLRPYLMGRKTELFIVMTMYNEDEVLFVKTMNAVIKNIAHLCGRSKSKTWGPEGWKKVVVCIVSDGRTKINQRTLKVIQLMGCYQDGIAKDEVAGKDVTAHLFEYTSTVVVSDTGEVAQGGVPVQLLFCLKEQNKKKLNSHRWFFNAFGPLIKPNVCILLDVGTKPTGTSIYELWKCFDRHSGVGGACGEICVDTGRNCSIILTSPLAASQNFEYKMSNILDKPLESVFGYISVLPGAFSAYRYKALLGKPLEMYFKGETMHGGGSDGAGLFERNMYLAEDRILCFEIVTKQKEAWTLKYVKSAKASTDVPTTIAEFISQRRRWLNGSFFAALHATTFQHRIWTSGQNFFRKIILQIEFWYNAIQMIFAWTSLANFYLAFFFLVSSATANADTDAFGFIAAGAGSKVFEVFLKVYIALLFVVLICSLGNRPQGSKATYGAAIILFGICNIIALWCAGFTVYMALPHSASEWANVPALFENRTFRDIVISLAATYGLYFFASFMHAEPYHMFTSFLQYLFWLPSYVNILMMYAMCNLHDLGWGTKGDNGSVKDLGGAKKVKDENGKVMAEVDLPTSKEDVDSLWAASRTALRNKPPETKEKRDAATKLMDADRNSRTNVVLLWMGTNAAMIIFFTSELFLDLTKKWADSSTGGVFNPYLSVLFYALAGLSAIRFVGSALYLLLRLVGL